MPYRVLSRRRTDTNGEKWESLSTPDWPQNDSALEKLSSEVSLSPPAALELTSDKLFCVLSSCALESARLSPKRVSRFVVFSRERARENQRESFRVFAASLGGFPRRRGGRQRKGAMRADAAFLR